MGLLLVPLSFHRVTEIDWSSSNGLEDFVSYDLATGSAQGYPAQQIAPLKSKTFDDGPVTMVKAPATDVNRLLDVIRRTISGVARDYQQYRGLTDDDTGRVANVSVDIVHGLHIKLAQKALWTGDEGYSFTAEDLSATSVCNPLFD